MTTLEDASFSAALHQSRHDAADPWSTAEATTATLGGSRAQLDRVFAVHDTGVSNVCAGYGCGEGPGY